MRGLCKLLCGLLAKPRLLRCNTCLQPGLRAKSLCALLLQSCLLRRSSSLCGSRLTKLLRGALPKTSLLRCNRGLLRTELANALSSSHLALLLLLEGRHRIGLRLAVALVQEIGNRGCFLFKQAAFKFGALHTFSNPTKGS